MKTWREMVDKLVKTWGGKVEKWERVDNLKQTWWNMVDEKLWGMVKLSLKIWWTIGRKLWG